MVLMMIIRVGGVWLVGQYHKQLIVVDRVVECRIVVYFSFFLSFFFRM